MNWNEEYKKKLVSAEEAVKIVNSNDRVVIPLTQQPALLPVALAARREELRNVEILTCSPTADPGWYQPGWEGSFIPVIFGYVGDIVRPALDEKRADFIPHIFSCGYKTYDERIHEDKPIDVFLTVVSPPNKQGFCSFGMTMWHKKGFCQRARKVLAEVDENLIRTYGDNFIHISEIDYFVEHTAPTIEDSEIDLLIAEIESQERRELVKELLLLMEPGMLRLKKSAALFPVLLLPSMTVLPVPSQLRRIHPIRLTQALRSISPSQKQAMLLSMCSMWLVRRLIRLPVSS